MIVRHSHRWTNYLPIEIRGYIQRRLHNERRQEAAKRAEEFKRYRHTKAIKSVIAKYREVHDAEVAKIDWKWDHDRRRMERRNARKDGYLAMRHRVSELAHDPGVSLDLVNRVLRVLYRFNTTDAVLWKQRVTAYPGRGSKRDLNWIPNY